MGLNYRRRKKIGNGLYLNESLSGASISKRWGPITVNSRGHVTLRLGRVLTFRIL